MRERFLKLLGAPTTKAPDPEAIARGHEATHPPVRGLLMLAGLLILVAIAMHLVLLGLFVAFDGHERTERGAAPQPAPGRDFPAPRLQTNPTGDLSALNREESEWLNGYGWVDRAHGVVHIPVERAMELTVQRAGGGRVQ